MTRDERALEFVMGGLSPFEREAVMRERQVDPAFDATISALEADLSPLTGLAGTIPPPSGLFDRIADSIAREQVSLAGKLAVVFGEGEWMPYAPGIETRDLWNARTVLMRCTAGAVIRAHHHAETENLVVISGDLVIGGRSFTTGDWHSAPAGTDHDDIHTVNGCVLLIQHVAA